MSKLMLPLLLASVILTSCTNSSKQNDTLTFSPSLINSLFSNLNRQFTIDFKEQHLKSLLKDVSIKKLQDGKVIEKEFLFEEFECNCEDKIKISFNPIEKRFILLVYEEFYEEGLDWCPESSYTYSFKIEHNNVIDLKLDFMAG